MSTLPRPTNAPRKIPLWAWHLEAWWVGGKQGTRPADAPKHVPLWFWSWRLWRLALAEGKGSKAWKKYHKIATHQKVQEDRAKIVAHAKWGAANTTQIHYTMDSRRDDWLMAKNPNELPQYTDCSGFSTQCYYAAGVPDPNGLNYIYLGYTGTELENAQKNGKIFTDVSLALPGDIIVIGPGTGDHEVVVLEQGTDPLVATHGGEGVQIQRLSVDPREPKRVCQTLPS